MDDFQIKCNIESRKKLLQDPEGTINGIDYIEVKRVINPEIQNSYSNSNNNYDREIGSDVSISEKNTSSSMSNTNNNNSSSILLLLFLFKEPTTPETIKKENFIILGGTRIRDIGIKLVGRADEVLENEDLNNNEKEIINSLSSAKRKKLIVIKPTREGDFSVYTLKLVADNKEKPDEILHNFDPVFSQIDFSFKIDCSLDFDCKVGKMCPPVTFEEPLLDYMAKDYASFVKLILARFSHIIPDWKERSPADLTNVLIELLSYVGDHLSYYQDAVSTEAYLGTARKRISIKRHARLLDYFIGEGSNARTWVCFEVKANKEEEVKGLVLKKSTKLLTGESAQNIKKITISEDDLKEIVYRPDTMIFETMHDINLYTFHSEMFFYTWGETDCCLPKGATHATLLREIKKSDNEDADSLDIYIFSWETILENEQDQQQDNLKNFMMRISSIFHDKDAISLFREDRDDRKILKMVDNDNPSKFIYIELIEKEECVLPRDNNNNIVYERAIAKDNNNNVVYEFMVKQSDESNNDNIEIYSCASAPEISSNGKPERLRPAGLAGDLLEPLRGRRQPERSHFPPARLEADLLADRPVEIDARHHHPRQRERAPQLTDESGRMERGSGREVGSLDEDDVVPAQPRQPVEDRAAADPTPDHHRPRSSSHPGNVNRGAVCKVCQDAGVIVDCAVYGEGHRLDRPKTVLGVRADAAEAPAASRGSASSSRPSRSSTPSGASSTCTSWPSRTRSARTSGRSSRSTATRSSS